MAPWCACAHVIAESLCWAVLTLLNLVLWVFHYPALAFRRYQYSGTGDAAAINRKTVVIVGGNFAGLAALHELAYNDAFNLVLIDQHEYFEYTPGVLRLFCRPSLFPTMAEKIPSGPYEFVLGTVTSVNHDHVAVACSASGPRKISFDYLILATGADVRQPITAAAADSSLASRAATWHREAAKVQAARSVLILGGGAVGTELAAEIACFYPEKQVTIVDAMAHLVPMFPRQTVQYAEDWFRRQGVELVLGELLEKWDESSCTTKSGQVIKADLVFVCFGIRCNSQCVAGGDVADCLSARREVNVNEYFQVDGQPHIFAVGDVMVHPSREIKQAYYAEMNGKVAALNVMQHASHRPLHRYPDILAGAPAMPLVYVLSLGRHAGSLGFNTLVLSGALVAPLMKWFIEWTKVQQMRGQPIGHAVWAFADSLTFLLSRTVLKPCAKGTD